MRTTGTRRHMSLDVPDFSKSGYLGSVNIDESIWRKAEEAAAARQQIAAQGDFQRVKRDPVKQWQSDLKGAVAEVGFGDYIALIAELNDVEFELVELVADSPVPQSDVILSGLRFDIKGCSGLVEGKTSRDDKLLVINCLPVCCV